MCPFLGGCRGDVRKKDRRKEKEKKEKSRRCDGCGAVRHEERHHQHTPVYAHPIPPMPPMNPCMPEYGYPHGYGPSYNSFYGGNRWPTPWEGHLPAVISRHEWLEHAQNAENALETAQGNAIKINDAKQEITGEIKVVQNAIKTVTEGVDRVETNIKNAVNEAHTSVKDTHATVKEAQTAIKTTHEAMKKDHAAHASKQDDTVAELARLRKLLEEETRKREEEQRIHEAIQQARLNYREQDMRARAYPFSPPLSPSPSPNPQQQHDREQEWKDELVANRKLLKEEFEKERKQIEEQKNQLTEAMLQMREEEERRLRQLREDEEREREWRRREKDYERYLRRKIREEERTVIPDRVSRPYAYSPGYDYHDTDSNDDETPPQSPRPIIGGGLRGGPGRGMGYRHDGRRVRFAPGV